MKQKLNHYTNSKGAITVIQRQSNVTYTKWSDLRKAINTLIQNGTYKKLADIHANTVRDTDGFVHARHRMHGLMYGPIGMRRFLPLASRVSDHLREGVAAN